MVNLSRRQTMQTCCWVSGTQSLRAGGWSGGWNLEGERRFLPAEFRSLSLSVLFEEGMCVGVLPVGINDRGNNHSKQEQVLNQELQLAEVHDTKFIPVTPLKKQNVPRMGVS